MKAKVEKEYRQALCEARHIQIDELNGAVMIGFHFPSILFLLSQLGMCIYVTRLNKAFCST
jgi:hypothetical protein